MAYADYEHCQGCDGKVIYTADTDVSDDVVAWHQVCLDREIAARVDAAVAAEREAAS